MTLENFVLERRHVNFHALFLFILIAFSILGCSPDNTSSKASTAQSNYSQAKALYDSGNFAAAIESFKQVLAANPDIQTRELAQYYLALSFYNLPNYSEAENQFSEFINYFSAPPDPLFQPTYVDASYYWRGRSKQKQNKFLAALDDYNYVINNNTSVYVDNARFEVGNDYYEWAASLLGQNPPQLIDAYAKLLTAESEFSAFMTNYATSTYFDDAAYFTGRTFQRMAEALQLDSSLDNLNSEANRYDQARAAFAKFETDTVLMSSVYADAALYFSARTFQSQTAVDLLSARAQYRKLLDNSLYSTSTWRDDAQYELAITYYDEAIPLIVSNETSAATNFELAITNFNVLLLNPNNDPLFINSSRRDNALYFRGRSFERLTLMIEKSAQADTLLASAKLLSLVNVFSPSLTSLNLADLYSVSNSAFQLLLDFDPTSNYADDAKLEMGVMLQSRASNTTITVSDSEKIALLEQAVAAYQAVAGLGNCNPDPKACSSGDNAAYFLGTAYADILAISNGDIAVSPVSYTQARATFQQVITNFPTSNWIDNAYYQMAALSRQEGTAVASQVLLERALNDFAQVIVFDAAGQYVDNSIYYIAYLYQQYSPASIPDPLNPAVNVVSDGCKLAYDWYTVYVNLYEAGTSVVTSYAFSHSGSTVNIASNMLTYSTIKYDSARAFVTAYDNATNADFGCLDMLNPQSLSATIAAPTMQ